MTVGSSALVRCLTLLGLSLAATVSIALLHPSLRPPRWDLFACLMVGAVAAGASIFLVRRPVSGRGDGAGRRWWADQRNAWVNFATMCWPAVAFLVAHAVLSPSPAAWTIFDAGHAIRSTKIEKVLSTERIGTGRNRQYDSTVRVSVPYETGTETYETGLISRREPLRGEETWVLFAPSSPESGYLIGDRQWLEEQIGGRADAGTILVTSMYLTACWLLALVGRWRSDPVGHLPRGVEKKRLRVLPVRVTGVGVAIDERPPTSRVTTHLKPRVHMASTDGDDLLLHFYLDDIVNHVPLAKDLKGARGTAYWYRDGRDVAYAKSVGVGVLVLDDGRFVAGWLVTADPSAELPDAVPGVDHDLPDPECVRAIHPASPVEAHANYIFLRSLLAAIPILGVTTFGVGDAGTVVLAITSVVVVLRGRRRARRRVQQYLKIGASLQDVRTGTVRTS
ncbi:hypothetical protein [Streptomyces sp. NPDC056628]|uniref:hypothetical protein n=1 Tax=Streptomyces sp. NPDC056628 TaxID=3345882 RepID=UPI0036B51381